MQPVFSGDSLLKRHKAIAACLLLGLLPLAAGCPAKGALDRLPIHGTVTLPGGEKLNGAISFLPASPASPHGSNPRPSARTKLTEGSYQFDRSDGPTAGPQQVLIQRIVPR